MFQNYNSGSGVENVLNGRERKAQLGDRRNILEPSKGEREWGLVHVEDVKEQDRREVTNSV